jgi:hypothetical protein
MVSTTEFKLTVDGKDIVGLKNTATNQIEPFKAIAADSLTYDVSRIVLGGSGVVTTDGSMLVTNICSSSYGQWSA